MKRCNQDQKPMLSDSKACSVMCLSSLHLHTALIFSPWPLQYTKVMISQFSPLATPKQRDLYDITKHLTLYLCILQKLTISVQIRYMDYFENII